MTKTLRALALLCALVAGIVAGDSLRMAHATEQFANTAQSTISHGGGYTSGATSLVLASSAAFPSSGNFRLKIVNEILLGTANNTGTNTVTVTRAQEGTSAASIADGATVTHILTAGALTQLEADAFTAGGDLSGTATSQTVAKVNGSTVPAGGSLTTGAVLRVTGASALGYGAVDLTNASAVTGVLPIANESAWTFADTYANRPSAAKAGRVYYATDGHTPFVDTGSTWAPLLNGVLGVQPPAAATLSTSVNIGTATLTDSNGALVTAGPNDGATLTLRGWVETTSTTTCNAEFAAQFFAQGSSGNTEVGVMLRESSSAKAYQVNVDQLQSTTWTLTINVNRWTANTTRSSVVQYAYPYDGNGPVILRIRRDNAGTPKLFAEITRDRQTWTTLESPNVTTVFTSAPNQIGIDTLGFNSTSAAVITHYVRTL